MAQVKKYQESCRGTEAAEKGNIQISDVNLNDFGTEYPRLVPSIQVLSEYLANTWQNTWVIRLEL